MHSNSVRESLTDSSIWRDSRRLTSQPTRSAFRRYAAHMTVIPWISVGLFGLTGLVKLISLPASLAERDKLNVSRGRWLVIGALEVLGALGVAGTLTGHLPNGVGIAAASGFVLLMVGAMATRISHRPREKALDVMLVLDVLTFGLAIVTLVAMARR